ncbi:hypothetical protein [Paenibacillus sp. 1001270B_150601_E10]|uniref:hypothetical protein n=1 Tax=Paenibacillus sp. 1001270B_150601_E10 TaxID=2787079 RepID=UPI00189F8F84|nr:hypothetical protein [Paenibacillus sp. 1001270B_150601_E10]
MLLKKKSTIISITMAFILAIAACYYYFAIYNSVNVVSVHAQYKGYSTGEKLFEGAELVVIGKPVTAFGDREIHLTRFATGVIEDFATFTEIHVEKVLKGPKEDTTNLTVIEPVVEYQTYKGKVRLASEGYTPMKKDSRYLIFLKKNRTGQYYVINMQEGKFNLDGTDPEDSIESPSKSRIFTELKAEFPQELR